MDTLQARFRDKSSEILQENPTMIVAIGRRGTFSTETFYFVGNSDELYCIVRPNPAIVEAVREHAHVAFTVNKGFPNRLLQGTGRAFFLGGLDQHPQIREQTQAKIPDAASFLTTIRNLGVLKILPDQIYITDDTNLGLGPRPAYFPEAAQALPSHRQRWLQAGCAWSWSASLIPVLIGALLSLYASEDVNWLLFIPVVIAAVLFQTGTTLVSTANDFDRNLDRMGSFGSSRVLVDGLLPVRHVFWVGILCFAVGSMIALALVALRGMPLLLLGLVGVLGGFFYTGWPVRWKYRAMGDVAGFVLMGPLMVIGSYFVLTGSYRHSALLIALPIGFLMEAILHAGNLRAIPDDAKANIHTMATVLGWVGSQLTYAALIGLPYVMVLVLIAGGLLPGWGLLAFLSVPLAVRNILHVWRSTPGELQHLSTIDVQTSQLHLAFGLLLALGLVLGYGG